MIDHMEPEFEEPTEQAQVEDITNLVWIKVSPDTLTHAPCILFWIFALCFIMIVH
jgi:hypothetical protein